MRDNWYALFLCIVKSYSVDQSLGLMKIRPKRGRHYDGPICNEISKEYRRAFN